MSSIILIIGIFLVPILFGEFRKSAPLLMCLWLTLLAFEAVAITNAFYFTTLDAHLDARYFYNSAAWFDHSHAAYIWSDIGGAYPEFVGTIFKLLGSSIFVNEQISILAYTASAITLVKYTKLFDQLNLAPIIILLFGLLPNMIFHSAITMREPFEILLLMLSVFYLLKYVKLLDPLYIVLSIVFAFAMGTLHNGLLHYAGVMLPAFFYFAILFTREKKSSFYITLGLTLLTFIAAASIIAIDPQKLLAPVTKVEAIRAYMFSFQQDARTAYNILFNTSSVSAFLASALNIYMHYMLAPFPWQVHNFYSFYAFCEQMLRFILTIGAFYFLFKAPREKKKYILILLFVYFSLTLLWSSGTLNYGTGLRHHLTTYWIVALLGTPGVYLFLKSCCQPFCKKTKHLPTAGT